MIRSTWNGVQLSRMMLGTVQFGMPYGVANRTGQPEYRDVVKIVAAAIECGVNCFDTAAAYGTSEEALGRALHELGVAEEVTIVTKVMPLNSQISNDDILVADAIECSVANSRKQLQLDCLPVVLFHREADAIHRDVLERLRGAGWLRQIGVSCDNRPGPAMEFVTSRTMQALQIPGNILDRRHERSGIFGFAASNGVAVFVRSIYLQGLLLMPESEIPAGLSDVIPIRRRLTSLAAEAGMDLAELAVRYMLSQNGVTCVIAGVETVDQVRENIAIVNRGPLPADLFGAVVSLMPDLSEAVVTPSMWREKKVEELGSGRG